MQQPIHCLLLLFITVIIYSLFLSSNAQSIFPSEKISNKWSPSDMPTVIINGAVSAKYVLIRQRFDIEFVCSFICQSDGYGSCQHFLFAIFLTGESGDSQIVWSANRDHPVRENAALEFSKNGDLLLLDFDGTLVWSTRTSGRSVVRMELNEVASLVLLDNKNNTVWSSMDYPTDSLVLGQTLREGQRLTANISITNSSQGPVYLSVVSNGIQAFVGSQIYFNATSTEWAKKPTYFSFNNGSLDIIAGSNSISYKISPTNSVQFMRLDYGGHLRVYEWWNYVWRFLEDVDLDSPYISYDDEECQYATVCGEYEICSKGQCSCPDSTHFRQINESYPNKGCMPSIALSCQSYNTQQFLSLPNVSYFGLDYAKSNEYPHLDYIKPNLTEKACKQACLANCSCKAAFFQYDPDASNGYCYLPPELYALKKIIPDIYGYHSSAFIKVHSIQALCVIALVMRRCSYREDAYDDEFNMLPGLPTRFAFKDLLVATNDFLRKLGEGGFGSVFEGSLIDGTKIAVKRLDRVGQGKKEFLAEVETIGSIHHLHLVRLIGFCAEKSCKLLIYEYMLNGSLDKWIFYKDHDTVLDWQTRRKIITDIAKGLTYLHEECRHKIIHLDIKPQNILLDENFNAKVSDFGLAKLIDRDQIEVMTRMRGTPGYLAPEWLTSVITEKVDVYSFGVVVLEIICGRRNLDHSKDEVDFHLIGILQRKIAENKLVDMLDCRCMDMQIHIKDVIMIMHLAMWCLQSDSNKRPLMSVVLKVLEGSMAVETDLDYDFLSVSSYVSRRANVVESVQPIPSILSGPR